MAEAKSKKDTLKARAASAKTNKAVNDMVSGMSTSSALSAFERMEEKVMSMEAEAEAMGVFAAPDDLEKQFKALEAGGGIDDELQALKKSLPGASSKGALPEGRPVSDAIESELDALRKDYESRIDQLEARIMELEKSPAPAPAAPLSPDRLGGAGSKAGLSEPSAGRRGTAPAPTTPPARNPAAEEAAALVELRAEADEEFRGTTEIRDITHGPDYEHSLGERFEDILEGYPQVTASAKPSSSRQRHQQPPRTPVGTEAVAREAGSVFILLQK